MRVVPVPERFEAIPAPNEAIPVPLLAFPVRLESISIQLQAIPAPCKAIPVELDPNSPRFVAISLELDATPVISIRLRRAGPERAVFTRPCPLRAPRSHRTPPLIALLDVPLPRPLRQFDGIARRQAVLFPAEVVDEAGGVLVQLQGILNPVLGERRLQFKDGGEHLVGHAHR